MNKDTQNWWLRSEHLGTLNDFLFINNQYIDKFDCFAHDINGCYRTLKELSKNVTEG